MFPRLEYEKTMPSISSVEIPDGVVMVSTDEQSPIPNEITIYGSDLSGATSVELDSGDDLYWVVTGISASSNSIIVTAVAFGNEGGSSVSTRVNTENATYLGPTMEVYCVLPLMD